jgi:hypothetical protein
VHEGDSDEIAIDLTAVRVSENRRAVG